VFAADALGLQSPCPCKVDAEEFCRKPHTHTSVWVKLGLVKSRGFLELRPAWHSFRKGKNAKLAQSSQECEPRQKGAVYETLRISGHGSQVHLDCSLNLEALGTAKAA